MVLEHSTACHAQPSYCHAAHLLPYTAHLLPCTAHLLRRAATATPMHAALCLACAQCCCQVENAADRRECWKRVTARCSPSLFHCCCSALALNAVKPCRHRKYSRNDQRSTQAAAMLLVPAGKGARNHVAIMPASIPYWLALQN